MAQIERRINEQHEINTVYDAFSDYKKSGRQFDFCKMGRTPTMLEFAISHVECFFSDQT